MAKGGSFEGQQSKLMSLWLTNDKRDDWIWRTSGSGARATIRFEQGKETDRYMFGDLGPTNPAILYFFKIFSVECKSGYRSYKSKTKIVKGEKVKRKAPRIVNWSLLDIIDSNQAKPIFYELWEQAVNDGLKSNREPLLIFRRNHRQACIAMHYYILESFETILGRYPHTNITISPDALPQNKITICYIKDFYKWTKGRMSETFLNITVMRKIISMFVLRRKGV